MGLAAIDLRFRADGPPLVSINGVEVAGVVSVTARHAAPSMPQIFIELAGEVTLIGEGIVIGDSAAGNTAADVATLLGNLDPEKIDEAAMAKYTQDGRDGKIIATPGRAFIEAILDAVEGVR
jgi:hypothetical protein